jgi:hypothetical protein
MAITDGTAAWPVRESFGTLNYKNLFNLSFGYTQTHKKVAAGTNTSVLAATAGASTAQTVTTNITQPDVPRALSVTVGGSAAGVQAGSVIVTGTNREGKVISEAFPVTVGFTGTLNGVKAFKTVTSVFIPAQLGATATFAVGTRNVLGVAHRLYRNNTTVKVYSASDVQASNLTLQGVPTVTANESDIELNTVTPATAPDGSKFLIICYTFANWSDGSSVNDQPEYSTTTSTSSTSSSTSTTTITTSTSSTSSSTSSTSQSTSSTSQSTSSTSTSTTTAP